MFNNIRVLSLSLCFLFIIIPKLVAAGNNGLLVYYPFDESSGTTAFDFSGNNYNGHIFGASRVEGKVGNGLLFGANDSNIFITDFLYFENGLITIEVWIKPDVLAYGETYRIIGDSDYSLTNFQIRDKKLEICYEGTSYHYGTTEIPEGIWSRVAFTSDGKNIETYINSVLDKRTNITLPANYIGNVRIGANWVYASDPQADEYIEEFPGIMDEFKVWDMPYKLSPHIEGTPTTIARPNEFYSFTPSAFDPFNDTLTFSIEGKPSWATFNTSTGELSGTPSVTDIGLYSSIIISVHDQDGNTDFLNPFNLFVTDRLPLSTVYHLLLKSE